MLFQMKFKELEAANESNFYKQAEALIIETRHFEAFGILKKALSEQP
jgi:hypothetical protein